MAQQSVLIVDDALDIQQLLKVFFERQGYQVYWAGDGQEAIEVAQQHLPDLILMDIQMPRKNGVEAVRELRALERFAKLPIIAMTAHARQFTQVDILQAGFNQVIFKPFDFTQLRKAITEASQQ